MTNEPREPRRERRDQFMETSHELLHRTVADQRLRHTDDHPRDSTDADWTFLLVAMTSGVHLTRENPSREPSRSTP